VCKVVVVVAAADVLAQPTRARVYAVLTGLRRAAGTDELAAAVGLHPNGVRTHLERLRAAGLVTRSRERGARGRPRDRWAVDPGAADAAPDGYADLSRWLVAALAAAGTEPAALEATGRAIGRGLTAPGPTDAEARMHDALAALGFRPARERDPADPARLAYRLRRCPYRDAVRERPALVCGLHRGLTQGLLDALDPSTTLEAFVPEDPDTAGCCVALRGGLAADPGGA
jgi:predicted ArsR family transcriptional regulator